MHGCANSAGLPQAFLLLSALTGTYCAAPHSLAERLPLWETSQTTPGWQCLSARTCIEGRHAGQTLCPGLVEPRNTAEVKDIEGLVQVVLLHQAGCDVCSSQPRSARVLRMA